MRGEQNPVSQTERGLETFLRGFSATRSLTHPYPVRQLTPSIWVLSDAPRAKGAARKSEVIVYGAGPEETLATIRREAIGRHMLCVLVEAPESADATRDLYKQQGYRFIGGEAMFVLPLAGRAGGSHFPVRRVRAEEDAAAIAKAARQRLVPPEYLKEEAGPIRLYGAFDNETPVGWVRSVATGTDCNWVADLFVQPDHRRRGIGKSLMSAMLAEDARYGATHSALMASKTGALLYPQLGYEQHGLLLLFYPPRS
jgi:GNAT superfamily N-acetyltransferase